jgi:glyoxylase-like metal-dependent hydrolase (beta-lactamase superfamily II)
MKPDVTAHFHNTTNTITYIVADASGGRCAIIDSVRDYDPRSGRMSTDFADKVIEGVRERGYTVDWILETHAHADHPTAAPYIQEQLGGRIAIGQYVSEVQATFKSIFNLGEGFATDGSQFDHLFGDNEDFNVGKITARVMHTPGHTPACVTYVVGDAVFVGDTLFMPDFGTARADFPGSDAATLFRSIQRILSLAPETRLFMCHDYGPDGRKFAWETTVAEERSDNVHVHDGVSEEEFVKTRTGRDNGLDLPALILPSLQINIRAGRMPPPDDNGVSYLRIPINQL